MNTQKFLVHSNIDSKVYDTISRFQGSTHQFRIKAWAR